jgi:hypothetical protein
MNTKVKFISVMYIKKIHVGSETGSVAGSGKNHSGSTTLPSSFKINKKTLHLRCKTVLISVPDLDPKDPYGNGPPGSGSGSFHQQAKNLDFYLG